MRGPCVSYVERLIGVAEGVRDPEVEAHIAGCAACAQALTHYEILLTAAKRTAERVPSAVALAARGLMRPSRRTVLTRLVGASMAAGARAAVTDVQLLVEGEGQRIRLMYSQTAEGWQVLGQAPSAGWRAQTEIGQFQADAAGRFGFVVPTPESTGFQLTSEDLDLDLEVLPFPEIIRHGS